MEAVKSLITAGVDVNDTDEVRPQTCCGDTSCFPARPTKMHLKELSHAFCILLLMRSVYYN